MTLQYSLLDEPLIRARLVDGGQLVQYSLPSLFVALARGEVRDFPALRPHQRHPWHAFLVQLAAMALHHAGQENSFEAEQEWKCALLALTPEHPDGAAWCLISPYDKPAFMQAPVPNTQVSDCGNRLYAPDELDMLVTSKNHDLKAARMRQFSPDDWVMALISLQTQEGFFWERKLWYFPYEWRVLESFGYRRCSRWALGVTLEKRCLDTIKTQEGNSRFHGVTE